MNPLISIIIPTFNRAHVIGETLDSIIAQTYDNWECIVVDDGSNDNTQGILNKYINNDKRFQYHERPADRPKGANACRNYGFEISAGQYINFLDSDDLYLPVTLCTFATNIEIDCDVIVGKVKSINILSSQTISITKIKSNNLVRDYIERNVTFYVCGPLWKKSFLSKQVHLFDCYISNLDDWDFNLRMIYQNPKIKFLDDIVVIYRVSENSLSSEISKFNLNEIKSEFIAREKHLHIIKKKKILSIKFVQNTVKNRYNYFLREALIIGNYRLYFLLKTYEYQLYTCDLRGFCKTTFAFIIFVIFKKGYKLLN